MTTTTETILITGATTGIGKHTALKLAELGYQVIATGRNESALEKLAREPHGSKLTTLRLDVTDKASIAAAAEEVLKLTAGRGLDVLINNAGYGMCAPMAETTDADLRAQYETNVFGLMNVTRAFLPRMMERRRGKIINVSSVAGRVTMPLFGAYNSSKYALESLSDAMRRELAAFGVKVVLVEPGPIKTEFSNHAAQSALAHANEGSPYANVYARTEKMHRQADAMSVGPATVVNAIVRAIRARRPSARYVAPFVGHFMLALVGMLPTWLVDAIMRRAVGLTPRALGLDKRTELLPAHAQK
jgi:NAD(P)-dependent dehydrogenase (short-subunit alcohol dehydrogenase family)